jgi:hypothetical protein
MSETTRTPMTRASFRAHGRVVLAHAIGRVPGDGLGCDRVDRGEPQQIRRGSP